MTLAASERLFLSWRTNRTSAAALYLPSDLPVEGVSSSVYAVKKKISITAFFRRGETENWEL